MWRVSLASLFTFHKVRWDALGVELEVAAAEEVPKEET